MSPKNGIVGLNNSVYHTFQYLRQNREKLGIVVLGREPHCLSFIICYFYGNLITKQPILTYAQKEKQI